MRSCRRLLSMQIATQVFPVFEIPNWAVRLVVLSLILGFPVALILSWAFEDHAAGHQAGIRDWPANSIAQHTGRKIVALTIVLGVAAAGLLAFQLQRPESPNASGVSPANGLKCACSAPEQEHCRASIR